MTAVPPLFHWSPAERRQAIRAHGLLPASHGEHELTTCSSRLDYVCLSPDPRRAWSISGGMGWTPGGPWDLWQIRLSSEFGTVLRLEDGEVWEWKVYQPIPPDRLWLIATRTPHDSSIGAGS